MKKYGLLIVVLVACVFSSMVSESTAIYTHSDFYNLSFIFEKPLPIIEGLFVKYELSDIRICDYNRETVGPAEDTSVRKCAAGKAEYDEKKNVVTLKNDSGFFKYYDGADKKEAYLVNGSFTHANAKQPKNFGMYFNGSYYHRDNMLQSMGYVALFNDNGDLVISEQGVENNYGDVNNHAYDNLKTMRENPVHNVLVASKGEVASALQNSTSSSLNLQVRVSEDTGDVIYVHVYINGKRVNDAPIKLSYDLRIFTEGIDSRVIIGASTYGANSSVIVTHMSKETWDGTSL